MVARTCVEECLCVKWDEEGGEGGGGERRIMCVWMRKVYNFV